METCKRKELDVKLYLAHPFDSRTEMRQWELEIENRLEIEIVNPFYDITRDDVDPIDMGRAGRYEKLNPQELVERDLEAIERSNGVIAYINGDLSYGTIMEIVYAKLMDIPVYLVCTNGHHDHPWLRHHAKEIFTSKQELEEFLGNAV
jgi:nucleoside 2-deoxyribosyltransferase